MVSKNFIFFTGTAAIGQTPKDPIKISENTAKVMASEEIKNNGELEIFFILNIPLMCLFHSIY